MKKEYISPELDLLILETTDIITASVSGDPGDEGGSNTGGWDEGWD